MRGELDEALEMRPARQRARASSASAAAIADHRHRVFVSGPIADAAGEGYPDPGSTGRLALVELASN
jgi:hypothetical protein